MTVWIVLGCVLLAFFLISLIRVGGLVEYSKDGLLAKMKAGPLLFTLYPVKQKPPKAKKEQAEKKKKEAPPKEADTKPGGLWSQFQAYLPFFTDAAGRFQRKVRLDKLYLDFIAAAADPALAAMEYGYANAAIGMIWPMFENNFKIKERRIRTSVDFDAAVPTIYIYAALSLTIGQAAMLGLRLMVKFLKITSELKTEQKTQKEAA